MRISEQSRRWWVLGTMTGSLSMVLVDMTVVSVALPTIQRHLEMSQTELQWVVNAYLLSLAVLVALGGRIGDLLGRTRAFWLGAILFVGGSTSCGLAQSDIWLIASRVVQGVGAALMVPASQAIVANAFPAAERGRAMGIYAGVSMIFLALGPLLGGVLTEGVSWRAVFFVNVPIGIAMLAAARFTLRREPAPGGSVDWVGAPALVVGLGALVLALMQSRVWGWDDTRTIVLFAAAAVALIGLVVWELRQRDPLIELRLFRNANFAADNVVLAFVQFSLVALTVFGALWVQNVLEFSPIQAGLSLLPLTLPLLLIAPRVGRVYDRIGGRALVTGGALLVGLALGWNAAVLSQESYPWLLPGYLAMGIGLGLIMTPSNTDAMNVAAPELRGQASGLVQTMRNVGGTIGIAVSGTVVAHVLHSRLSDFVAADPHATPEQLERAERVLSEGATGRAQALDDISPRVIGEVEEAFTGAVAAGYWVGAGVMLASAVVAFALLRRREASDAAPGVRDHPVGPMAG
jgi:EmrB/QacA subfamily drug resistance transporter